MCKRGIIGKNLRHRPDGIHPFRRTSLDGADQTDDAGTRHKLKLSACCNTGKARGWRRVHVKAGREVALMSTATLRANAFRLCVHIRAPVGYCDAASSYFTGSAVALRLPPAIAPLPRPRYAIRRATRPTSVLRLTHSLPRRPSVNPS
jgi:hypothetical protein